MQYLHYLQERMCHLKQKLGGGLKDITFCKENMYLLQQL